MKLYSTLGELLIDYRSKNDVSQADFAANMDVDIRTVQRWEKNITLLKPDKEADLVEDSFLPYQLIRNLNTSNPIPTFYDFRIRKYSLSEISNDLPDINWIKQRMDVNTVNLNTININEDLPYIARYIEYQYDNRNIVSKQVLEQAIILFPELNLHLTDNLGFYSGHCIVLCINEETYLKLRNKEITNSQIRINDLIDYKTVKKPIFFAYNVTADSNNSVFYILGAILKFFRDAPINDYLFFTFTNRYDSTDLNERLGLKAIWKEEGIDNMVFSDNTISFFEGTFTEFLKES
jgi:transcriptional regulator with XRE-family HTH domain